MNTHTLHTHRQTDRQTDMNTGAQHYTWTDRQTNRHEHTHYT